MDSHARQTHPDAAHQGIFAQKTDEAGLRKGFDVELGEGDVGWPAVMEALDEIGYHGWGMLEVPGGDAARLKFLAERTDHLFAS